MRSPAPQRETPHLKLANAAAMARLGAQVAARLRLGEAICLWGALGAGKTTLARGLIRALTHPGEEVPSPTFTLVQSYDGRLRTAHFDLYRLKAAEEAFELGLDEALAEGVAVIEWPERLSGALPPDRLDIEIIIPETGRGRRLRLTGHGAWAGREREI